MNLNVITLYVPPDARAQNMRGGRVRLASIMMPEMEFNHEEKVGGPIGW